MMIESKQQCTNITSIPTCSSHINAMLAYIIACFPRNTTSSIDVLLNKCNKRYEMTKFPLFQDAYLAILSYITTQ